MSLLWIHSVICEMFHEQKLTRNIPTQVQNACELIDQAFPNTLPLNDLARKVGYSPNQLIRLFRKSIDVTPVQYEIRKKIEYAKGMLLYGNTPISEISVKVGYNDVAYFSKLFKKYTGYSPAAYRRIVHEKQL